MRSVNILSAKWSVSIDTMINFDSDSDEGGDGDDTCKQALTNRRKKSFSETYNDGFLRTFPLN